MFEADGQVTLWPVLVNEDKLLYHKKWLKNILDVTIYYATYIKYTSFSLIHVICIDLQHTAFMSHYEKTCFLHTCKNKDAHQLHSNCLSFSLHR